MNMLEQVMAMLDQPIRSPSGWSKDGKHAPVRAVEKQQSETPATASNKLFLIYSAYWKV